MLEIIEKKKKKKTKLINFLKITSTDDIHMNELDINDNYEGEVTQEIYVNLYQVSIIFTIDEGSTSIECLQTY